MSRIFISYRRGGSNAYAGRVYDRLADDFGEHDVFMDVDAIAPGADFVEILTQAVERCSVLLPVIGPDWLDARDSQGRPRLNDPSDFVRLEVAAGLQRGIHVIPLLVGGATMPRAVDLPPDLAALARRNAFTLDDLSWRHDVIRLVEVLQDLVARGAPAAPEGDIVLVELEPRTGRQYELRGGATIGRAEGDIVVADPKASRRHATIRMSAQGLVIEDLGSTNGTWVNEEPVEGPRELRLGDRVRVGRTIWRVERPGIDTARAG